MQRMSIHRGDQLGELVKLHRTARMLTQRQLAAAAGISLGTLRDLEQGRHRNARWQTVQSLAVALDIDQRQRAGLIRAGPPGAPVPPPGPARGQGAAGELAHIEILGPLTAWLDGSTLPLGSARQRAVLGLLALHSQAGLHRDAIIDALWGPRPPASALTQVHGYISRLRKLLGPRDHGRPGLITTTGSRYWLRADGAWLDLAAFSQQAGQADRAAAQRRPEAACDLYEQALAMWRGEALADIDLLHRHPAVTELASRRSDVVLRYADVAVRTAAPHRALPWLRDLCARDGFNEAAHAQLMIILAKAGQRAAALETFRVLRRRLVDELGVSPCRQLDDAHAQVLRLR